MRFCYRKDGRRKGMEVKSVGLRFCWLHRIVAAIDPNMKTFFQREEKMRGFGGCCPQEIFDVLDNIILTFYTLKYTICTNFQAIIMIITKNRDLPAKSFFTSKKVPPKRRPLGLPLNRTLGDGGGGNSLIQSLGMSDCKQQVQHST